MENGTSTVKEIFDVYSQSIDSDIYTFIFSISILLALTWTVIETVNI